MAPPWLGCRHGWQGRNAVRMDGHRVGGPEPCRQRKLAPVQEGAGGDRGPLCAPGAFVGPGLAARRPGLGVATSGVAETVWPVDRGKVGGAGGFIGKVLLKRDRRARIVSYGNASQPSTFAFYSSLF